MVRILSIIIKYAKLVCFIGAHADLNPYAKYIHYDGFVSNVNIFKYYDDLNLQTLSSSLCNASGDYISWLNIVSSVSLHGYVEFVEKPTNVVCGKRTETERVVLPKTYKFLHSNITCHLMKGKISEYLNKDELYDIQKLEKYKNCSHFWSPYSGI